MAQNESARPQVMVKEGGTEMETSQVPMFQMNGRGEDWESWCMTASSRVEGKS